MLIKNGCGRFHTPEQMGFWDNLLFLWTAIKLPIKIQTFIKCYGKINMKNTFLTLLAIFTSISMANAQATGGFEGPSAVQNPTSTVAEALNSSDESYVSLTGKIVNSLGDEKYTFKDETGEVVVEIDDEDWRGVKVTPENTITINGEVDKEMFEPTKIDVDSIVVK